MTNQKSELQALINNAMSEDNRKNKQIKLQSINRELYKRMQADVNKIQIKKIETLKEFQNLQKAETPSYLLVTPHEHYTNIIITEAHSKEILYKYIYYQFNKVRINQEIPRGNVYLLNVTDEDKKLCADKRKQRAENKKDSCLDRNSILFRDLKRDYGGRKDKSKYTIGIDRLYKKLADKFINRDLDSFIEFITDKETKMLKLYQETRNKFLKIQKVSIDRLGSFLPNYGYQIGKIYESIYRLQNKEEFISRYLNKYPESSREDYTQYFIEDELETIYRNFIEIMEREQNFKAEINQYIQWNLNK